MTTLHTDPIKPLTIAPVQLDAPPETALAVIPAPQLPAPLELPMPPAEPLSLKRFLAPGAAAATSLVSIGMALSSGSALAGVILIGATAVAAGVTLVNELTRRSNAPGADLVRAVQSERAALAKREAELVKGFKALESAKQTSAKSRFIDGVDVAAPAHLEKLRRDTDALSTEQISAIADGVKKLYNHKDNRQYYRFVAATYDGTSLGTGHAVTEYHHVLAQLTTRGVIYAGPVTLISGNWLLRATDAHAITSVAQLQNYLRVAGVLTSDTEEAR